MLSHSLWLYPPFAVCSSGWRAKARAPQPSCYAQRRHLNNCFTSNSPFYEADTSLTAWMTQGLEVPGTNLLLLSAFLVTRWVVQVHCFCVDTPIPPWAPPAFNHIEVIKLFMLIILPSPAWPKLCLKKWLIASKLPHIFHKEKDALSVPCYNQRIHVCQWLSEE